MEGKHRTHQIVSVSKLVPEVQKKLRKYQLTLELETQSIFADVESLAHEKRSLTETFSRQVIQMRDAFQTLRKAIQEREASLTSAFEDQVAELVESIDSKIGQLRNQIKKCQSYSTTI